MFFFLFPESVRRVKTAIIAPNSTSSCSKTVLWTQKSNLVWAREKTTKKVLLLQQAFHSSSFIFRVHICVTKWLLYRPHLEKEMANLWFAIIDHRWSFVPHLYLLLKKEEFLSRRSWNLHLTSYSTTRYGEDVNATTRKL